VEFKLYITIYLNYINVNYFILQIFDYQKKLKDSEQKYNEILNDYEVMKNYVIKKQQITDNLLLVTEKNVSVIVYSSVFKRKNNLLLKTIQN